MNNRPTEPLSAEERELATLLGRVGPHGEPSPALDAKILASAHAAVARDVARKPARRRRWPALAGLAASVLIAAGIGWQLLPRHEAAMQVSEAPVSVQLIRDASAPAQADVAPPAAESVAAPEAYKPAPTRALAPPKAIPLPSPAEPARQRRYEAPPADVAEPRPTDIVVSPAAPPAPPAPPAPAPAPAPVLAEPAPPRTSGAMQAQRALTSAPAAERKQAYAAEAAAAKAAEAAAAAAPTPAADTGAETRAAANDSATLDSVTVSGSRTDEPDVLGIDVEADTRLAKRDWLHRIELRRAQGDTDGARESLRLFVRKYPRATIPSDLRGLLKE